MSTGPLGILGGGQLGRMLAQAASVLGIDVVVGEREAGSPATRVAAAEVVFDGTWDDARAVASIARAAPIITLENEFVDAGILEQLERLGSRVWPSPACVAVVQDKLLQKQALAAAELPVPRFSPVAEPGDLVALADKLGWPLMLKARRDGYDGRGNVLVRGAADAEAGFSKLGAPGRELYAEAFVPFERELAVLVVRGHDGALVSYPVVETQQDPQLHICRLVIAPAELPENIAAQATGIARGAAHAVNIVGALGVELFLTADGQVLINELAPRPHNSAHYTIEACTTSQFSNHARAVLGLPLGSPALRTEAAVMVNLLGSGAGVLAHADLASALAQDDTFVHLYGKAENRAGRKLGHVTSLGPSREETLARARAAAQCLRL